MVGGSRSIEEASKSLGLPTFLLEESETYAAADGIYSDLKLTVDVFASMLTQWRFGPCGPTGLDYSALPVVLRLRRVPTADRGEVFDGLQIMERAALTAIQEQRK